VPKPEPASDNKYIRPVKEPVAASDLRIGNMWYGWGSR